MSHCARICPIYSLPERWAAALGQKYDLIFAPVLDNIDQPQLLNECRLNEATAA